MSRKLLLQLACGAAAAVFWAFCAGAATAPAQVSAPAVDRWKRLSSPVFDHITSVNGLPSDNVQSLAQSHDGFLWIGTQSGLLRYDGYRFRTFQNDTNDPTSLPADYVQTMYVDRDGELWVGTFTGGLARFDREHETFVRYNTKDASDSVRVINAIQGDGNHGLWVGSERGLFHLDVSAASFTPLLRGDGAVGQAAFTGKVNSLLRARDGMLWVGTDKALARVDLRDGSVHPVNIFVHGSNVPIVDTIRSLGQDSTGQIWVGTSNHGLAIVDGTDVAHTLEARSPAAQELARFAVYGIVEGSPGKLWIASYGAGVFVIDIKSLEIEQLHHSSLAPTSLGSDACVGLLRARDGRIWIATEEGLNAHDPANGAIQSAFAEPGRADRLSEDNVIGLMVDSRDRMWVGYHGGGYDVFDAQSRRVASLRPGVGRGAALPKRPLISFAESPDGSVWLGTAEGLFHTDMDSRAPVAVPMPYGGAEPFLQSMRAIPDGLLIGTNEGLVHFRTSTQKWQLISVKTSGLTDDRVMGIVPTGDGGYWVGTLRGLVRLDSKLEIVERIDSNSSAAEGLANDFMTDLVRDRQGRLWIATGGNGMYLLTGRNPQGKPLFRHFGKEEGLTDEHVDALLLDKRGRIWASTDNGISIIDSESLTIRGVGIAEGVAFSNYWDITAASTAEGDLLFGAIGGITIVHPDKVQTRVVSPTLVVSDLRVGAKPFPSMVFNSSGTPPSLVIPSDSTGFEIEFAALDFAAPYLNRYSYRLEGFDKDWIASDATRRTAAYTNLPPGSYTLHVRGSDHQGHWSEHDLMLPISVRAAWYQTTQIHILEVLAAIACVLLFVRARTAYLKKRQHELEEIVAERTEELRKSKIQLEEFAFHDALTSLPNRRFFAERFEHFRATSERSRAPFALILVDLDRFKGINDAFGHDAGDMVLIETTRRLKLATREMDFVARLGGDEFAVLLADAESEAVVSGVCDRLLVLLSQPVSVRGQTFPLSATLGVAIYPRHGLSQEAIYKAADVALYEAKHRGRNAWNLKSGSAVVVPAQ